MAEIVTFAKYTAAQLRELASKGQAMPDGSYPCADAEDVGNAIRAVGRGSANHDDIRKMIMRNAKRLGVDVPDNWQSDGSLKAAAQVPDEHMPPAGDAKKKKPPMPEPATPAYAVEDATEPEVAEARPPTRNEREQAAAAVREMQSALAPQVDALYDTPSGMDALEAFDHMGRAADALHHGYSGAVGKALSELVAAAELLRSAAGKSATAALGLNPIANTVEQAQAAVETWPTTHASAEGKTDFAAARLVLTQPEAGHYILTDNGEKVAEFAQEGDALQAVAGYALPEDDPSAGTPFNVFLAPEGYESGDGRLLELGTTTWRDPPLPLMMQDSSSHGPGAPAPAWFAGSIERVWRDPADASRIIGRGHLAPGADGQRAEAAIRAGLRGVSIDGLSKLPPTEQVTQINAEGVPVNALVRYSDTRIMGATSVPHPAFEPCCIWFDDESTPERVTATHGAQIPMDTQPEILDGEPLAALVASAGGPKNPPRAWFHVEHPGHYQPLTVRADGFISGHLGKAGSCHIGQVGRCTTIPASATNYRYFHRTLALTAEGEEVACGWLTMNTPHERNLRVSAQAAMDHYDHTGTQVAKVRITDTPHGPWMCGAIAPGLDERTIWALQGPEVSGDWRDIDGYHRELVAVLGVPLPGFLTQRPEALVASGQIVAQIGTLPCDECGPPVLVEDLTFDVSMSDGVAAILGQHDVMLKALRPAALAAMHDSIAPAEMVEAARKAAEPDPGAEWRERLRV